MLKEIGVKLICKRHKCQSIKSLCLTRTQIFQTVAKSILVAQQLNPLSKNMMILYKLLLFFCLLSMAVTVPIISAGITFGSPIYRPIGTPIYYERPYTYYHDNYYYNGHSTYPYDYSPNYEYVGGGIGGFHGSIDYSPYIF
ncbi:uncharacterized protein LOC124420175 [Lucilia cuprina]|uniref:uncharacterized protein LOC124420175 n=1 Tax=Lucilia cuprina TaxID=7375 RepID=UPI001F06A289|nr:uncharacterized protein LOC124420175 [Lucilia cuprina]